MFFEKITKNRFYRTGTCFQCSCGNYDNYHGGRPSKITLRGLGYLVASSWKVQACERDRHSPGLSQACTLKPVATPMALKNKNPQQYLPVSLKCPMGDDGTLSLVKKNKLGDYIILHVNYKYRNATSVSLYGSNPGAPLHHDFSIDLTDESTGSDDKIIGEDFAGTGDTLRQEVCRVLAK